MKREWTPFTEMMRPEELEERYLLSGDPDFEIWRNSIYQVFKSKIYAHDADGNVLKDHFILQLSIKRIDRTPIHDWRDLQRIKNELAGEEALAVEIYPPESKLVDTANQYFLWVVPPHWEESVFAFIFQQRIVSETPFRNSRQRPWRADERPSDLLTGDTVNEALQRTLEEARRRFQR